MGIFDYAPAPESRAIANLKDNYRPFINGEFVDGSGEPLKTINPATEEVLAEVSTASVSDVDIAVKAARKAYTGVWSKMPGSERAKYLFRIARLIQERSRELAVLESLDNGKPIKESRDSDVPTAAAHFFYHAGWADKLEYAGYGPNPRPLGVAGQVIPWNFPLLMLAWKIAPALATGNTVVLKPAETTPLTALVFAEICQQAELPPGVVNILPGAGAVGGQLVEHPGIDKIAFTGSTEVGKLIARASSESNLKRVSLELGGKSPNIVFADADLERAVENAVSSVFGNAGQDCCARTRAFVQRPVAAEFSDRVAARTRRLRLGDPLDEATEMGPLISLQQRERVEGYLQAGRQEGAQLLTGGSRPGGALAQGSYLEPAVFGRADNRMRIAREEIFGPVLAIIPFDDEADLLPMVNDTPYGLSGSLWTRDIGRALRVARAVRTGVISINSSKSVHQEAPFGGYKRSGIGRELGMHAIQLYTEVKNVFISLD